MTDYTHSFDLNVQGKVESSTQGRLIGAMDSLPNADSTNSGCIVLYTGATSGNFVNGKYYISNGTSWSLASSNIAAGTGISVSGNTISLSDSGAGAGSVGSSTAVPVLTIDAKGRITKKSTATIYPPTTAGTANQYWRSDGSGQGAWTTPATAATSGSATLISSGAAYTELSKKVDKVDGKGLSTNDYTTAEKSKLTGIETGAQTNIIETVKVNGTALTPSEKAVNIDLSGYSTNANTISGLSVSGTTITYTKGDGSTGTIKTQDTNTDTKVTQTNSTAATAYPILLKNGTGTGTVTNTTLFNSGVTITPSTKTVTATTFSGNATSATKATQDGNGKVIADTYATKTELSTAVTSVYKYKGSVAAYANLPTSATTGDVYNVEAAYDKVPAGTNWAWNGSAWDALAGSVDLSGYVQKVDGKELSSNDFTDALKTKLDGITASADSVAFSRSLTSGTKVGTITINGTATDLYCQTNTDTKNTAGSTDSSSKLFLIGATSQAANPQTYSHDTAYVGTDGKLYSGGKVVIASGDTATAATKATQDGSGNVITTTYQTKSVGTASRALVSDSNGNIGVSAVTSTELGYLDGVTSNVQTQLNNKENVKTPKTYNIPSDGKWYEVARISKANFASAGYNAYARILCGSDTTNVSGIRHVFVADVTWARGKLANSTTAEWFIQNNCPTVNSNNSGIYAFRILQPNANKDYDIIIELYARYASGDATHYTVPADVTILDSNVPVTMLSAPVASTYNSANHNNLSYNVGQYNYHVSSNAISADFAGRAGSSWDSLYNDRFKTGATVVAISGKSNRAIRNAYLSAVNSSGFLQHLQTPDVAFKLPLEGGRPTADFNINATYAQVANRIRGIVNTELTTERTIDSSSTVSASTRYYTKYLIDGGTTFKVGLPLYLKGSLDSSGNFVPYYTKATKTVDSVNYNLYTFYIYSSMQNGATNVLIGNGDHDTTHYTVHYGTAYTLDSSGNLTHIDGKPVLDSKVTQTNSTANTAYPILLKNGTGTGSVTNGVLFDDGVTLNPSTARLAGLKGINYTSGTGSWVGCLQGLGAIASTASAGTFFPILSFKSTNGSIGMGGYQAALQVFYAAKATVDAGTNTMAKTATLFDEGGNASWPGKVTATGGFAGSLSGNATSATKATQDGNGKVIADTYETKANAITGLSASGRTITFTKGDGTTGTITTQDNNTDVNVTQTNNTSATAYPILLKNGTGTGTITSGTLFNSGVTLTPSTGTITATTFKGALSGNADTATKATKDAKDQQIDTTYIKGLSASGTTITYTKGDGTTGTIKTQDNNTDTKVTQANNTSATAYPILLKNGTGTGSVTNSVLFNSAVTLTPSTGTITATKFKGALEGNANTATKATQDANGNAITTTYLAKSGGTMTGVLTAQTNTSYTTRQVRNVVYSTAEPTSSDGSNGDMWAVYE